MGQLTAEVFNPSCCDGAAGANLNSAQPCGCDPGLNYLCQRHRDERDAIEYAVAKIEMLEAKLAGAEGEIHRLRVELDKTRRL